MLKESKLPLGSSFTRIGEGDKEKFGEAYVSFSFHEDKLN